MNQAGNQSALFDYYGKPSFSQAFPLAMQHVVAAIVGCVTPAIIVSGAAGLNPTDKVFLIQAALVVAGLATLLQLFPIGNKNGLHIGAALPVIMGVSFAYVPSMQAIAGHESGLGVPMILGAQIVGFNGVDKRIEMLAQVIQRGGTVHDLTELEHAYAPPYSSAKDPVNMAGFVAENILNKKSRIIQWRELAELPADTIRIDVRTHDEYKLGTIPGFINIPVDELREHLDELPKEKPIVVTCAVGLRGYLAYRILVQNGFKHVRNLSGGYKTWSVATAPIKEIVSHKPEIPESTSYENSDSQINLLKVDACGLMCPGPVMQLKKNYKALKIGEQLQITATDQAFGKDVTSWCKMTGAELVALENKNGVVAATIRKQEKTASCEISRNNADNKTLIVFSDDLDKALASFVIANGAASTGKKVTMFFTFWGLNVIKKQHKPTVTKDIFGKMFGWMLPTHSGKLKLSKMNMGGAGSWMMRLIMKQKRIDSLESLIQQAIDNGVEMIACTMSMDVMGVQKEELMDNVTLGGVASYLERAEEANVNLFI